ncbi:MAG: hypothetical protein R3F62_01350 [Planctomycetota bacterium]
MSLRAFSAACLLALSVGCESVPEPTVLQGHVVDTTREPVPGVTVTYSPMFQGAPCVTDDTGAFSLEVPAAIVFKPQFKVLFDRPGFPLMSHQGTDLPEPVVLSAPRIEEEEPLLPEDEDEDEEPDDEAGQ